MLGGSVAVFPRGRREGPRGVPSDGMVRIICLGWLCAPVLKPLEGPVWLRTISCRAVRPAGCQGLRRVSFEAERMCSPVSTETNGLRFHQLLAVSLIITSMLVVFTPFLSV